ncbi:MAG: hypothetical protein Q7V57_11160 [Actinomycetota bacterium]|nr:hypothetical protein [Actinomycetota bacterium]
MLDFTEWVASLRESRIEIEAEIAAAQATVAEASEQLARIDAAIAALDDNAPAPQLQAVENLSPTTPPAAAAARAGKQPAKKQPAATGPLKVVDGQDKTLVVCDVCGKWVKPAGLGIHKAKAHPAAPPAAPPAPVPTPAAAPTPDQDDPLDKLAPSDDTPSLDEVAATYRQALADGKGPVSVLCNKFGLSRMSADYLVGRARLEGFDLSFPALDEATRLLDEAV